MARCKIRLSNFAIPCGGTIYRVISLHKIHEKEDELVFKEDVPVLKRHAEVLRRDDSSGVFTCSP
jgi:hypothetical protein